MEKKEESAKWFGQRQSKYWNNEIDLLDSSWIGGAIRNIEIKKSREETASLGLRTEEVIGGRKDTKIYGV